VIYVVLILIGSCLLAVALFYSFRSAELLAQLRQAAQREASYASELAKLEKIRHIPDAIERAKKAKAEGEARLADALRRAEAIIDNATAVAKEAAVKLRADVDRQLAAERTEAQKFLSDAASNKAETQ
jgi:hypothetical protein